MRPATTKFVPTTGIAEWRAKQSCPVVFTNGCFDLLHAGHTHLLEKARSLGSILVVGLNSDDSVRALKGKNRPINSFINRALVLSALESVDFVTPLEDLRADRLLRLVQPHIWVKGGDYTLATLDPSEREAAEAAGIQIVLIPRTNDLSSSNLLVKISN